MGVEEAFLRQGLLGAIIVALSSAIIFLYRDNIALREENKNLAEMRVNDLKELKDAYFENIEALKQAYFSNIEQVKEIARNTLVIVQALKEQTK